MIIEPIWLLAQALAYACAGVAAYISLTNRVTKLEATDHADLHERVVAMEAVFKVLGKKVATILHSPHDPWNLDKLLEKYVDDHYDLSSKEWEELKKTCQEIQKMDVATTDIKILAAILESLAGFSRALAEHKLTRYQREHEGLNK